jgi:DNA-binding HxlR family transcriptional regulator
MTETDDKITTRAIWLLLLKEGGRWSVNEIGSELGAADPSLLCRFMHQMCERGYLRRHTSPRERHQYSVDRTCKIPLFLTMGDLMDAGAVA